MFAICGRREHRRRSKAAWFGSLQALCATPVVRDQPDCGSGANDTRRFSDSFAHTETRKSCAFSCCPHRVNGCRLDFAIVGWAWHHTRHPVDL